VGQLHVVHQNQGTKKQHPLLVSVNSILMYFGEQAGITANILDRDAYFANDGIVSDSTNWDSSRSTPSSTMYVGETRYSAYELLRIGTI
jgi:hypothetical protein